MRFRFRLTAVRRLQLLTMHSGTGFFHRGKLRALVIAGACCVSFLARAEIWSTAYYPGWEQVSMPADQIDFDAVSHVIHFALVPNSNGSLNSSANGVTPANSSSIVSNAHLAGRKVLVCVGGADSVLGFQGATSNATLSV